MERMEMCMGGEERRASTPLLIPTLPTSHPRDPPLHHTIIRRMCIGGASPEERMEIWKEEELLHP